MFEELSFDGSSPTLGEAGLGVIRTRVASRTALRLGGRKRVCTRRYKSGTKKGRCRKWAKPTFSGKGRRRRLTSPKRNACKFGIIKTGRRAGQCRKQRRRSRKG